MNSNEIIEKAENKLKKRFEEIDSIAQNNQEKVLSAFKLNKVSSRHFVSSNGYGYDDIGRDTLCKVFADVYNCEKAIVSPYLSGGTHAIALALQGILRPRDIMLSVSGSVYDTLENVILGDGIGSLKEFGISYKQIELTSSGNFNYRKIENFIAKTAPKIVYIQRSRGYNWRNSISIDKIKKLVVFINNFDKNIYTVVDNCYGEFVDLIEPTNIGADVIIGSLIKNPGGGLAPTGAYIAGKKQVISLIENRLTVPGIGMEVGSYNSSYLPFYQGLFMAPHTVAQALKAAHLFAAAFELLGYDTLPAKCKNSGDIITSIKFRTKEELISFCKTIQSSSPVDSYVSPEPWDMPGYTHQVIMAAGTFVQGASIELSADSPIKEPYIAYMQGSLTYEHAKYALKNCLNSILSK